MRERRDEDNPFGWKEGEGEEEASFISRLIFFWVRPLFRRAAWLHKRGQALEHDDLLPLPAIDHGAQIGPAFEASWDRQKDAVNEKSDKPSMGGISELRSSGEAQSTSRIRKALRSVLGRRFVAAGFLKAVNTGLQFAFPLLLNAILKFIEETQSGSIDDTDPWRIRYRGKKAIGSKKLITLARDLTSRSTLRLLVVGNFVPGHGLQGCY